MSRAFVLLSGGIDSTTCLVIARQQFKEVHAVSIDYGQRHYKEVQQAREITKLYGIPHRVLNLSDIVPRNAMLTSATAEVPNISYSEIKGVSPTYVPFRNGLMLSAMTSFAVGERERHIKSGKWDVPDEGEWALFFGAHAEDAAGWAYPDCTPEFIGAMANAIYVGTYHQFRLHTPLQWLTKAAIIRWGTDLGAPWALTWSCYKGGALHCGTCPTCRARRTGFAMAAVEDPTKYEAQTEGAVA